MKNRHNFEISPKLLLIILTAVCIVLLSLSVVFKNTIKPFSFIAGTIVVPMQDGINSFGSWVGDRLTSLKSLEELKAENEELTERVAELEEENEALSTNEEELKNLQDLLELDQEYSQYTKVGASVISKGSGNWYNTFVINKGSDDGIEVNMNVLAGDGLVGIVTETGSNYAKVQSIIDDDSSVSARSEETGDTCVVEGNSETIASDGTIDVTYISKDAEMQEGEELVTSHISSKYLEGLRIGTVSDITMDSSNLTKSAKVTPVVDFEHIEDVLVITELKEVPDDSDTAD